MSVSTWSGARGERPARAAALAEKEAVRLLRGVGGDVEWWLWNERPAAGVEVGHLRVALTAEEVAVLPPGCALHDAGESGPQRPRTR